LDNDTCSNTKIVKFLIAIIQISQNEKFKRQAMKPSYFFSYLFSFFEAVGVVGLFRLVGGRLGFDKRFLSLL